MAKKHAHGTKVLLSVGGWTHGTGPFSKAEFEKTIF